MTYRTKQRLQRISFSIVLLALLLEVGIRLIGTTNADGQFYFQGQRIRPYVLPIHQFEARLEAVQAQEQTGQQTTFIYNENTGWSPRPNYIGLGGIWISNSDGIRDEREFNRTPEDNILRIAIFGGSFTAGDEVENSETWASVLKNELNANGIRAEVLNFGVNAFGTDQAYLRWQSLGQNFEPDIVLLGFMPENFKRNVNVLRPIYIPNANLLFSKPRFVLEADNTLDLVNIPPIPQDQIVETMRQFPDHPLAAYEYHYTSHTPWWAYSRFIGVIENLVSNVNEIKMKTFSAEEYDAYVPLTQAIITSFADESIAANETFIFVHLPGNITVRSLAADRPLPHQEMLDEITTGYNIIDVAETFSVYDDVDWMPGGHYSPTRNEIVGLYIAEEIQQCLTDGNCRPSRFETNEAYRE